MFGILHSVAQHVGEHLKETMLVACDGVGICHIAIENHFHIICLHKFPAIDGISAEIVDMDGVVLHNITSCFDIG